MGKRTEFVPERYGATGIVDGRHDLAAMTDDALVRNTALNVGFTELRHFFEFEIGKGKTESLALAQHRQPREAGLEALETYLLEQAAIVGDGITPCSVMV